MNEQNVDGYGVFFLHHLQLFHFEAVLKALTQHETEQNFPKLPPLQSPWKDEPAGKYATGSGI